MFKKRQKKIKSKKKKTVTYPDHLLYFHESVKDISWECRWVALALIVMMILFGIVTGDFVEMWKNGATL